MDGTTRARALLQQELASIAKECQVHALRRGSIRNTPSHTCSRKCVLKAVPLFEFPATGHVCSPWHLSCADVVHSEMHTDERIISQKERHRVEKQTHTDGDRKEEHIGGGEKQRRHTDGGRKERCTGGRGEQRHTDGSREERRSDTEKADGQGEQNPPQEEEHHQGGFCLGVHCGKRPRWWPLSKASVALYLCSTSGRAHFCGSSLCVAWREMPEDGTRVCLLTGEVLEQHAASHAAKYDVRQFWGYVPRHGSRQELEQALHGNARSSLAIPRTAFGRQEFFVHCRRVVQALFSAQRFRHEAEEHTSQSQRIGRLLESYLNRCSREKKLPNVLEAAALVFAERRRAGAAIVLSGDVPTGAYAEAVQSLWGILQTTCRETGGANLTKRGNFLVFVLAALQWMQEGLIVRSADGAYDITVIERDPLLTSIPVSQRAQETVLGRQSNLGKTHRGIRNTLQQAVDRGLAVPEDLRLANHTPSAFDEHVFSGKNNDG